MGKRFGVLCAAIAAPALTLGVALPAAGSSSGTDRQNNFRVTALCCR